MSTIPLIENQNLFIISKERESSNEIENIIETEKENEQNKFPNFNQEISITCKNPETNDKTNVYFNINTYNQNKPNKLNKKRGRISQKIKTEEKEHNKYSHDNVIQKIKYLIIKSLRTHINNQIIKRDIFSPKIITTIPDQIKNTKVLFNQHFLNKTVENIFSEKITSKCRKYPPEHNKNVIFNLMNKGKEENKDYFKKLFNLKFIDCLNQFRKKQQIEVLNGMKLFDDVIKNIKDDENIEVLNKLINDYEKFISERKEKKKK